MSERIKIAVAGQLRSGKNTAVDTLSAYTDTEQLAFADPIRRLIEEFFPETVGQGKPRWHLQQIGECFRKLNTEVWINALYRDIDKVDPNKSIMITDCRYANEAEHLKKNGFIIVKITCPEDIRIQRLLATEGAFDPIKFYHESELEVDKIVADYTYDNSGTLEGYETWLEETYAAIIGGRADGDK